MDGGSGSGGGRSALALGVVAVVSALGAFVSWRDADPGVFLYVSVAAALAATTIGAVASVRDRRRGASTAAAAGGFWLGLAVTAMWLLGLVALLSGPL